MFRLLSLYRLNNRNRYAASPVLVARVGHGTDFLLPRIEQDQSRAARAILARHELMSEDTVAEDMAALPGIRQLTLQLLGASGVAPAFGEPRDVGHDAGVVVLPGEPDAVVRTGLRVVVAVLNEAAGADPEDTLSAIKLFRRQVKSHRPRGHHRHFRRIANERGLPWRWDPEVWRGGPKNPWLKYVESFSLCEVGEGRFQKWGAVRITLSSSESEVAYRLQQDKLATSTLLGRYDIPVGRQATAADPTAAWRAAQALGLPVVVKPRKGTGGVGVSVDLRTEERVRAATARALEMSKEVIVETHLDGDTHRIIVAGGRIIGAWKYVAPTVTGDGERSVRELVEGLNAQPERQPGDDKLLSQVKLDDDAERLLAERGYTFDSVLPTGQTVALSSLPQVIHGGYPLDVTDEMHPDNATMSIRAAELLGLETAGVDLIITDISRSHREVGGGICEVNARPHPKVPVVSYGIGQPDRLNPMFDAIFGEGGERLLPSVCVVGPGADDWPHHLGKELQHEHGFKVGVASTRGVELDGWRVSEQLDPAAARDLIAEDPTLDVAICTVSGARARKKDLERFDLVVDLGDGLAPDAIRGQLLTSAEAHQAARLLVDLHRARAARVGEVDEPRKKLTAVTS